MKLISHIHATLFFFYSLFLLIIPSSSSSSTTNICIIGSGISGSSVAHFLRHYAPPRSPPFDITMMERNAVVGGRMATVDLAGETFEAGGTILHPKNYHALDYTRLLNLTIKWPNASSHEDDDDGWFGIWDGKGFVFKTWSVKTKLPFVDGIVSLANNLLLFFRYGFSLLRMNNFVQDMLSRFLKYYESCESRPIFKTVDEMLKWNGLYNLTTRTLEEELIGVGLSPLLIQELVTIIMRINYGQSVSISGFAGAVSLAGAGGNLWSVKGGNWQMAAGLIKHSNVALHLHEEIQSVSYLGKYYELNSTKGNSYKCDVAVVATPLDEVQIQFDPLISIPPRKLQHTHATFVRGVLNPAYFSLSSVEEIPDLVATLENPSIPFSSISVLKRHGQNDMSYKVFSRQQIAEDLLDKIFSVRKDTVHINWGAYPHYNAPEVFAPFILDGHHLYYVNAFENAASTMETGAVAAENVARLILSRLFDEASSCISKLEDCHSEESLHMDL